MNTGPRLGPLQLGFQAYVVGGRPGMEQVVVSDETASASERLEVYFNAYRLRLLEALGNDCPALKAFVGDEEFEKLGRAYIDMHPSNTPSIRWFGRHLPEFLRSAAPYAGHPVLAEVAAFEWQRGEVFDAPDAGTVTAGQIAAVPPDAWPLLRFTLHPAMRRLKLDWNAPAICKAILADAAPPQPQQAAAEWLLWRRDPDVHWRSLDRSEAEALDAAAAGATFAEVCEGLLKWVAPDQVALHAAGLLKRWVTDGMVAAIHTESDRCT